MPKKVWAIRFRLDQEGRLRARALFALAIDSKLRGCDLVPVHMIGLVRGNAIRDRATVVRRKTARPVQSRSSSQPGRPCSSGWSDVEANLRIRLPCRINQWTHLSTRQYGRLVGEWASAFGPTCQDYET